MPKKHPPVTVDRLPRSRIVFVLRYPALRANSCSGCPSAPRRDTTIASQPHKAERVAMEVASLVQFDRRGKKAIPIPRRAW